MNKFRIVLKSIFLASTFVISAFAEDKDTAFVPFTVNVDAVATARLDGVDKFEKQVRAGYIDTLHIITEGDPLLARPGKTPNPVVMHSSRGKISLELSQQFRSADIALYSLNGKQVLRGSGEHPNLAMGVYLLSVRGVGGSTFTTRFAHSGGGLNIDVGFGSGGTASLLERAIPGNWTITVSAEGYLDTLYVFFPETGWGNTPVQIITLVPPSPSSSSSVDCPISSVSNGSVTCGGQTYRTVNIGGQIWFAENLNYNASGSKCYDNDPSNCVIYGRLYNWATAMTACPSGWHLPSKAEWEVMTAYIGGWDTEGKKLKATSGWNNISDWNNIDVSGNGSDDYGFSALPGGYGYSSGSFYGIGDYARWWVASEYEENGSYAYYRHMFGNVAYWENYDKSYFLFNVRCVHGSNSYVQSSSSSIISSSSSFVQNSSSSVGYSGSYGSISYGGQTYKTVVIGTQVWFAENLNYNASGSKCYDNDPYNCVTYGKLYDWATAMALSSDCNFNTCSSQMQSKHQGICPSGWHIPTNEDWDKLYRYADGTSGTESPYTSSTAGRYLKAKSGWGSCGPSNASWLCEDTYGFSALPGGLGFSDGSFNGIGNSGRWWSASEYNINGAYAKGMSNSNNQGASWSTNDSKSYYLFSVRCVQD